MNLKTGWLWVALVAIVRCASAEETDLGDMDWTPRSFWINPGDDSYHFDRHAGYREDNWGIGGQIGFDHDLALLGGTFLNSDNRRSHDVGVLWEPLHFGVLKFGAVAGGFDGYPYFHSGNWFPALLPMASVEYEAVGANLTVVPNYKNKLHGAVVLQVLVRLWH